MSYIDDIPMMETIDLRLKFLSQKYNDLDERNDHWKNKWFDNRDDAMFEENNDELKN